MSKTKTEKRLRTLASYGAVYILPDRTEGEYLIEFLKWEPGLAKYCHVAARGPTLKKAVKALYDKWSYRNG